MDASNNNIKQLKLFLDRLLDHTSQDTTRPNINGVLFGANIVATDGYRMCVLDVAAAPFTTPNLSVVPRRWLAMLRETIKDSAVRPVVSAQDDDISFTDGDLTVLTKYYKAHAFPPYVQILPKYSKFSALVPRVALARALETREAYTLTFESKQLTLTPQKVYQPCTLQIDGGPNESFTIGVNGGYLSDAMRGRKSKIVSIACSGEHDPIDVYDDVGDFRVIVMPVRL